MESIVSRDKIATQARQDARDAAQGARVYCPYPQGSEAAQTWTATFSSQLAALQEAALPQPALQQPVLQRKGGR